MSFISVPRSLLALVCLILYGSVNVLLLETVLLVMTGAFSVVAYRFKISPIATIAFVVVLSVSTCGSAIALSPHVKSIGFS